MAPRGIKSERDRQRVVVACAYCRYRKIKCCGNSPCYNCKRADRLCAFVPVVESANFRKGVRIVKTDDGSPANDKSSSSLYASSSAATRSKRKLSDASPYGAPIAKKFAVAFAGAGPSSSASGRRTVSSSSAAASAASITAPHASVAPPSERHQSSIAEGERYAGSSASSYIESRSASPHAPSGPFMFTSAPASSWVDTSATASDLGSPLVPFVSPEQPADLHTVVGHSFAAASFSAASTLGLFIAAPDDRRYQHFCPPSPYEGARPVLQHPYHTVPAPLVMPAAPAHIAGWQPSSAVSPSTISRTNEAPLELQQQAAYYDAFFNQDVSRMFDEKASSSANDTTSSSSGTAFGSTRSHTTEEELKPATAPIAPVSQSYNSSAAADLAILHEFGPHSSHFEDNVSAPADDETGAFGSLIDSAAYYESAWLQGGAFGSSGLSY